MAPIGRKSGRGRFFQCKIENMSERSRGMQKENWSSAPSACMGGRSFREPPPSSLREAPPKSVGEVAGSHPPPRFARLPQNRWEKFPGATPLLAPRGSPKGETADGQQASRPSPSARARLNGAKRSPAEGGQAGQGLADQRFSAHSISHFHFRISSPNRRMALAVVIVATSSTVIPRSCARRSATSRTYAGSFRLPR